MALILIIVLFILSIIETNFLLGGSSNKNIVASRASSSIKIDGFLNELDWTSAVPVSGFIQFDPEEGNSSTENTSVKILYDNDALYVGVMCFDSDPSLISKQLTRRDRTSNADRFAVIIDSYHDHSTAFLFSGSVSGVQSDGLFSHDGLIYDIQWDAVWDFNAKILSNGWSGEFKIPFSALRFTKQDSEYVWGINFRRFIARKNETDEWVMVPRKDTPPGCLTSVSLMGNLSGIVNINPPLHIECLPYHTSKINRLSHPVPFPIKFEYEPNIGLDIKYGITNNFTLDMAVNPDFGQVEVDKAVLNLTVFETQYPEKRPFFLEGSQIFTFGNSIDNTQLPLLYSRRIGKRPSGYDSLSQYDTMIIGHNATYKEKPEVTTILAAGKLTGTTGNGLQIGALSVITDKEEAIIKGINNNCSPNIKVEPRANYNALRLKQNIGENSTLGLMATSAFKQTHSPSLSGGLDWNLRLLNNEYGIDGYIAGSKVDKSETGTAGRLGLGKFQGEHWIIYSAYEFSSRNFDINDIGYYSQSREHGGYLQVSYKEDQAAAPIRRYAISVNTDYRWNWEGVNTLDQLKIGPAFEFRNFWKLTLNYIREFPAHDDINKLKYRNQEPIYKLYHRPSGNTFTAVLRTDSRKAIELYLQSGYLFYSNGANTFLSALQATVRPLSWMEFVPGFTFITTKQEEAWLIGSFSDSGYNKFGDRDVKQYDISLRGIVTFTRSMSLQFFNQVLLAKWRYTNFKELISRDYLPLLPTQPPEDRFYKIFNANIVFRWEYLPGSTFYLVWTQAREKYTNIGIYNRGFSKDFNDVFRIPADNVFLAKITYLWSH